MKKLLFHGFDEHYLETINLLNKNYDWEPVINVGKKITKNDLKKLFPKLKFLDIHNLRKFKLENYTKNMNAFPLDIEDLNKLENFKEGYYETFDDTNGHNFSQEEKKTIFIEYLCFWKTLLKNHNIDLIIFFHWPHRNDCYSLYLIAKHVLGIKILILDSNFTVDSSYQTILKDIHELDHPFKKKYLQKDLKRNNPDAKKYLEKLQSNQVLKVDYKYVNKFSEENIYFKFFKNILKLIILTLIKGTGFKKEFYYKKNYSDYFSDKSRLNHFEYEFFIFKKNLKILKLENYYNKICQNINFQEKYVLYAAPYQPEPNTSQMFLKNSHNVFVTLSMLSKSIPKNWKIFYREHPATFKAFAHNRAILIKNKNYYRKIKKISNLVIVSHKSKILTLLNNAQAVVSNAGTIGFESIANGIPALTFGNCWYSICKSNLNISSQAELDTAVRKIEDGYKPDINDVLDYLYAVCESSEKNITSYKFSLKDPQNYSLVKSILPEQQKRLANFLFEKYGEYYK